MAKRIKEEVLRYDAFFEPCDEGGFTVTVPKLPGVVTEGNTFEEAMDNVKDARTTTCFLTSQRAVSGTAIRAVV